jgi:transcriptional regulator with AAA-type ATPase domain
MSSFTAADRRQAGGFRDLSFGNPFLPERLEVEARVLGKQFVAGPEVWSWSADPQKFQPNLDALQTAAEKLVARYGPRIRRPGVSRREYELFADVACYVLYYRCHAQFLELAQAEIEGEATRVPPTVWKRFRADHAALLGHPEHAPPFEAAHLFAVLYQTRRAFVQVFTRIIGGSRAAAQLRAEVWHSVFTHDRRRHATHLTGRMRDLPTLILGASGTGKELVATAVAQAQFRPFSPESCVFAPPGVFLPMNLAAVPETLVESTLFGHKRGSFTGATMDRKGAFENVDRRGCVFLDEIGEIPPATQVKLLRVLQERRFQRVGDLKERAFDGKIIAATHRDLHADIAAGSFRSDLYYRISGDLIRTPTLAEQINGDREELGRLVRFIAERVAGVGAAEALTDEVVSCVERDLVGHAWPGNFRELEQCVRNVLVRRCYRPDRGIGDWLTAARDGKLTADALLDAYVRSVHQRLGSYAATAEAVGLDRRTVKARVAAQGMSSASATGRSRRMSAASA